MAKEVEIKFRVNDVHTLTRDLKRAGFRQITRPTHEINDLYDLPGQKLRKRGDMLRLRKFGDEWLLTHKAKEKSARHKSRVERETKLEDGKQMDGILRALGLQPTFRYEKYRAEWSDGTGHVVVDETPIGNFGEIEGKPRWIDRTARSLGIDRRDYITQTYTPMFFDWKRRTHSSASEMTFRAVREAKRRDKKRANS
jgi:adenylate cyclase, class 2